MAYVIPPHFREWLTIDDVPTRTHAWRTITHRPLLAPARQIGQNRPLAGGVVIANPRTETETVRDLPMMFFGSHDWEGNLADDPLEQVYLNYLHFTETLVTPAGGDGTRSIVLHLPGDLPDRAGRAHVSGSDEPFSAADTVLRWTLTLSIPTGRLVPA